MRATHKVVKSIIFINNNEIELSMGYIKIYLKLNSCFYQSCSKNDLERI